MTAAKRWSIFLGGCDLEMVEIGKLLADRSEVEICDHRLAWGATASAYTSEIREAIQRGDRVAAIELSDDLPDDIPRERIHWIDHHGALAGAGRPTSIEQIFQLLEFPPDRWTRDLALVAANDRGHIRGLREAGATSDEIRDIRARDRAAQGIAPAEEAQGRDAAERAERYFGGRLLAVRLPHARTATVTDVLPDAENLIVFCPEQTVFFGTGRCIDALRKAHPEGWFGGELPERGYWGCAKSMAAGELVHLLERPIVTESASKIAVPAYRQILFWPLILKQLPTPDGASRQHDEWLTALRQNWGDPVKTLPATVTPAMGDDITFEEIVYFHPFVRDFLYGDGDPTAERTLRRLKRSDVTAVKVQYAADGPTLTLDVARLELYLCKPLVALMVIEVHQPKWLEDKEFMLADALTLQSQLRQVHPPFFIGKSPGNCPHAVTFVTDKGEIRSDFDAGRDHFARFTHRGAEPPVASHWQSLLAPLKPFPGSLKDEQGQYKPEGVGLFYQQVEDDRMPGMTFLTVPNPREISDGDLDRLTWCDTPGLRNFPYSGDFLNERRKKHVYTRFWDGRDAVPPDDYATLYLCSGYQFVMLCCDGSDDAKYYLWDHFRLHYFWMGLILHCQRSVLLKFQDDLVEAVKLISGQATDKEWSNPKFRERIAYIQMTFLKFRTRAGFTEVSNQLQGRELFAWWMNQLGTDKLFAQVDGECQRLHSSLAEFESRELTKIAFVVLPFTVLLSALSVFASFASQESWGKTHWDWVVIPGLVLTLLILSWLGTRGSFGPRIRKELTKPSD